MLRPRSHSQLHPHPACPRPLTPTPTPMLQDHPLTVPRTCTMTIPCLFILLPLPFRNLRLCEYQVPHRRRSSKLPVLITRTFRLFHPCYHRQLLLHQKKDQRLHRITLGPSWIRSYRRTLVLKQDQDKDQPHLRCLNPDPPTHPPRLRPSPSLLSPSSTRRRR